MTVCVAAIYDDGHGLLAASDREISGIAKYQSPTPKVRGVTTSIMVMFACEDVTFQALIHNALQVEVNRRLKTDPATWQTVEGVAFLYEHFYNEARRHRIEQAILEPRWANMGEFLAAAPSLAARDREAVLYAIDSYTVPHISALIIGMDRQAQTTDATSWAHIYSFSNWDGRVGAISCHDDLGYAAIGSGATHAESHLTKVEHGPTRRENEALLHTFLAKKRGQAGPGVGEPTDLFYWAHRHPNPGFYALVGADIYRALEQRYKRLVKAEFDAIKRAQKAIDEMLAKRRPPPQPSGQAGGTSGPEQPPPVAPIAPGS